MDLFIINRYIGDDINNTEISNEDDLRKKLLKKIKKRRQLNETIKVCNSDQNKLSYEKREKLQNSNYVQISKFIKNEDKIKTKNKIKSKLEESQNNEIEELLDKNMKFEIKNLKINKKEKRKKSEVENLIKEDENEKKETNTKDCEIEKKVETEISGFTILNDVALIKKEKGKRKLPDWLANPCVVSVDLKNLTCTVDSMLGLDKIFVDKLKENNITHFFPVQSQIIPWLLENANRPEMYWPNDICVSAPTGSGKTLAFVLPILQVLYKRIVPSIRALIVLPVQDLANQVYKVFDTYSKSTDLKILLLSKSRLLHEEQALICKNDGFGNWKTKADIIITTPGRLVEHLNVTKGFNLSNLRYLVIDEADRVMEKVQNDWLYHLNKCINSEFSKAYQVPVITYNNLINKKKPPNKLLFSATLSQDPEKLQQLGLFQPKLFTSIVKSNLGNENEVADQTRFIGKYTTPAELRENYAIITKKNKPLIVYHLLKCKIWRNVLCFVNSAEATFRLSYVLKTLCKKKIKISKLSANLSLKKRDMILQKFLAGQIDVLVCSDALARGMDIPNVKYVISYDAPKYIKTYIHRIGRTGRAGKEGTSLTLLTSKEVNNFQRMLKIAGKESVEEFRINSVDLEPYETDYAKALDLLGNALEKQKERIIKKAKRSNKLQVIAGKGRLPTTGKKMRKKMKKLN